MRATSDAASLCPLWRDMITNFTEIRMGCSSVVRVAHIESPFAQNPEEQLGDGRYTFAFFGRFPFL